MTTAAEVQDRADELAGQLERLSQRAANAATAELRRQLAEARRELTVAWIQQYGSVAAGPQSPEDASPLAATAILILSEALAVGLVASGPIAAAWLTSYRLGVDHGLRPGVPLDERTVSFTTTPPPVDVGRPIAKAGSRAIGGLDRASIHLEGFTALTVAMARAEQAVKGVEAVVATHVTTAAATGVTDVAEASGWARLWVAERDACVHCLAYAGHVTTTSVFPTGLTFGDKPLTPYGPLLGPPLHPHCRCVLELIDPHDHAVPAALKREAKRSVLRGFSLDTESEAVRLRAADRLLARGSTLPESVKQYARRAVRLGEFPRGRDVPTGDRRP